MQVTALKSMGECMKPKKTINFKSNFHVIKGVRTKNQQNPATVVEFVIMYKNNEVIVHEEILVYDTIGNVSQLGGVISLFIGISFFSLLCELLDFIRNNISKKN